VELEVRCGGQGETAMRVMEHERLECLLNYVVNVDLLKIPATKTDMFSKWGLFSTIIWGEKNFEECIRARNGTRDSENQK
jgi:hypothetical protein